MLPATSPALSHRPATSPERQPWTLNPGTHLGAWVCCFLPPVQLLYVADAPPGEPGLEAQRHIPGQGRAKLLEQTVNRTWVCVCVCGGGGASGCWLAGRPLQTAAARAGAGAGTHSGPAALRIMRVPHRCWCTLLWPSWGMRPWTARQTSTQRGSQQVCRGAALVVGLLQHAAKHCRATRTCAPARCRC
jgi:hypothetical protein